MASGRPRRPNDPSVMASVETALSSVARPGIFGLIWNWRYELGLSAGLATVGLASGYALGAVWLALAVRGAGRRWGAPVGAVIIVLFLAHDIFSQLLVIGRFYS